jgi:hypothetical protein
MEQPACLRRGNTTWSTSERTLTRLRLVPQTKGGDALTKNSQASTSAGMAR